MFHAIDVEPEWPDEAARPVRSRLHKFKGIYEKFQKGLVARLKEARLAADVEVADRYGRWDAEVGNVVPPEGPVVPTTLPLIAPVG